MTVHIKYFLWQCGAGSRCVFYDTSMELPTGAKWMLLICTNGAFQHPKFLSNLIGAAALEVKYIPLLAEDNFRIPTEDLMNKNPAAIDSVTSDRAMLISIIVSIFKAIAIIFQPSGFCLPAVKDLLLLSKLCVLFFPALGPSNPIQEYLISEFAIYNAPNG